MMPVDSENGGIKGNLEIYMLVMWKVKKKKNSALLILLLPFSEFSFTGWGIKWKVKTLPFCFMPFKIANSKDILLLV